MSNITIEALMPGQEVSAGDITLKIVSFRISGDPEEGLCIDYECTWFNDGVYMVAWLNKFEFKVASHARTSSVTFINKIEREHLPTIIMDDRMPPVKPPKVVQENNT